MTAREGNAQTRLLSAQPLKLYTVFASQLLKLYTVLLYTVFPSQLLKLHTVLLYTVFPSQLLKLYTVCASVSPGRAAGPERARPHARPEGVEGRAPGAPAPHEAGSKGHKSSQNIW